MKNVVILISILTMVAMGILSCSNSNPNMPSGGGTIWVTNVVTNEVPVTPPDSGGNGGSDNNQGGGGNNNGNTDGGGNGGGVTPPTGPDLSQYKGLALRIATTNPSVIGKTYIHNSGPFDYKVIINKDGTMIIYIGSAKYNQWKRYDWDAGWGANPITIMELNPYSGKYEPTIDSKTGDVNKIRVRLVNFEDNGNKNNINIANNSRIMFELTFKDNYTKASIRRTYTGPQMTEIHDFNVFNQDTGVSSVDITVQN